MSRQLLDPDAQWMDDASTEICLRCKMKFGVLPGKHKHHCRWCGNIYCEKCAPVVNIVNGTPCLPVKLKAARKCNACRVPFCCRPHRDPSAGALKAAPMDIILSFLDARSTTCFIQSCSTALNYFHVPKISYYTCLQDRFPTLFTGAQVGKGGCGTVYKVEDRRNGNMKVAVKVVRKGSNYSWTTWNKLLVEIDIMTHNDHPNIARLLEVFQTPLELVMVIELGEGGSLKRAFEIVKRKEYDAEVFTAHVIAQVASGIDYLYNSRRIVHRDIKHDNIVLSKDFSRVMIIDFGLAEYIRSDTQKYVPCGTMGFASPENILAVVERKTSFEAPSLTMHLTDMFSLGVVAFMMLSGQKPLKGSRFHDLHQEVKRGIRCTGSKWQNTSDQMKSLVEWLLQSETKGRALPADVERHPAITSNEIRFMALVEQRKLEQDKADKDEGIEWIFVDSQLSNEWKVVCDEDFTSVTKTGHVASPTLKSPASTRK